MDFCAIRFHKMCFILHVYRGINETHIPAPSSPILKLRLLTVFDFETCSVENLKQIRIIVVRILFN